MDALVASTYFIIVCLWLVVLGMVGLAYRRSPSTFGASHLLLAVVAIDTTRNIVENVFFGLYFSSRYNFINRNIITFLDHPYFILLPKLVNISAACVVIVLLLRRWLPMAQWERTRADDKIRQTTEALVKSSEAQRVLFDANNYIANFDQLTGLPNRHRLQRDLRGLHAEPQNPGSPALAVVVFEIDGYRDLGHTLGSTASEALIRDVAHRATVLLERSERCYRLGDGEFALVIPGAVPGSRIIETVRTLQRRVGDPFDIDGSRFFVTTSVGIAFAGSTEQPDEDLLSQASLALDDAKAAGGGIYRLYSPALGAEVHARLELEGELRRAHLKGEFVLYFQPQVRLKDDAVVGAEALLRWRHPQRGVLAPASFIDALAKSPIACDVGRWVLETACKTAASWLGKGLPLVRVGVNLFPAQFRDGVVLRDVKTALLQSGLPAEALEIEITEDIALDHDTAMIEMLKTLRATGVSLAVDDFGTGYASLSYLARYPLDRIKIDKSFVAGTSEVASHDDTAMARSIIAMAHNLKLEVIAEGVETASQAAFLRSEGCEEAQGFLYGQALEERQFREFLATGLPIPSPW